MSEMHEVVKLLLARMESHPEEFLWETGNRWQSTLGSVREYGTPEEIEALDAALRIIMLQQAHEGMLDELLNGDERRRKEQEEHDYERRMMQQQAMRISANGSVGIGSATPSTTLGVTTVNEDMYGKPLVSARHPTSSDMEKNGILNAVRNIMK